MVFEKEANPAEQARPQSDLSLLQFSPREATRSTAALSIKVVGSLFFFFFFFSFFSPFLPSFRGLNSERSLARWPDKRGRQRVEGFAHGWIRSSQERRAEMRRGDGSLKEAGWFLGGGQSAVRGARWRERGSWGLGGRRCRSLAIIHSPEISCLSQVSRSEMSLGRERESHHFITIFTFFLSVFVFFWISIAGLITQKNSLEPAENSNS